ncbi:MAG: hypothetical protein WBM98_07445 [Maribacter sp.]|uniref:hypothetical protein n=1 Tax=Maribacter sp. TaxID=1897614 RepID=UPI003C783A7A
MKKTLQLLVLALVLISQSCEDDDCGDISCFTEPTPFEFELVDKTTGENLFTNNTFDPSDLKVIDRADDRAVEFAFISENDYNIIGVYTIGWQTETVQYAFQIGSEPLFELFVDGERLNINCCSYTEYNEIRIENAEFQLDEQRGIYKILVE